MICKSTNPCFIHNRQKKTFQMFKLMKRKFKEKKKFSLNLM